MMNNAVGMRTYRITLRPRSATVTPWQADTLFGHLCWQVLQHEGSQALDEFLAPFKAGAPPLLLSDGFPEGYLPRPRLPVSRQAAPISRSAGLQALRQVKDARRVRWVSLKDFNRLRAGEFVEQRRSAELEQLARPVLKNQINRLTGTTSGGEDGDLASGNLFTLEELGFRDPSGERPRRLGVQFYLRAADDRWRDRARELLGYLAESGYGARKSSGYGQFSLDENDFEAPFEGFEEVEGDNGTVKFSELQGLNGFVSLCHWVPAAGDPTNGYYATRLKYGKLGEGLAQAENPFKFPLVQLGAGSCFYTSGEPKAWYGRLIGGRQGEMIAPGAPQVVHYGYAFALPARLAEEGP